jgi:hypothetical protein
VRESLLDTSKALNFFLKNNYLSDFNEILGDLQLAWIILLYGQNLEGLDYWCAILKLICNAHDYLSKNLKYFKEFVMVIDCQIRQIPHDIATSVIDPSNNVIGQALNVCTLILFLLFIL